MASNITREVLRDTIRDRGEFDSDDYFPSSLLNTWINDSIAALYDELVKADPARFLTQASVSIVSGTEEYALAADFYKLVGCDLLDSSAETGYRPMERFNWNERHRYGGDAGNKYDAKYEWRNSKLWIHPPPEWSLANGVRVNYIPTAPSLSADEGTWDTVNLWSEWVVLDVCEKCAVREDSLTQAKYFGQQRDRVWRRITESAEGDNAGPKTVVNVRRYRHRKQWYPT